MAGKVKDPMVAELMQRSSEGILLEVGNRVRVTHDFDQPWDVDNIKPIKDGGKWVKITTSMIGKIVGTKTASKDAFVPLLMLVQFSKWKTPMAIAALNLKVIPEEAK